MGDSLFFSSSSSSSSFGARITFHGAVFHPPPPSTSKDRPTPLAFVAVAGLFFVIQKKKKKCHRGGGRIPYFFPPSNIGIYQYNMFFCLFGLAASQPATSNALLISGLRRRNFVIKQKKHAKEKKTCVCNVYGHVPTELPFCTCHRWWLGMKHKTDAGFGKIFLQCPQNKFVPSLRHLCATYPTRDSWSLSRTEKCQQLMTCFQAHTLLTIVTLKVPSG